MTLEGVMLLQQKCHGIKVKVIVSCSANVVKGVLA